MRHLVPILLLVILVSDPAQSQPTFERTYGGKGDQYGFGVAVLPDGYAVCGHTALPGSLITDVWVLRLNEDGDTIWTRQYGGPGIDNGRSILVTDDSNLVVCGTWSHTDPPKSDFLLIKLTMDGDTLWTRSLFTPLSAYGYSVAPFGKGYILCGYADSARSTPRMMIVRVDSIGEVLWARLFGDTASTAGFSAVATTDGGVIACGYIDTFTPAWNRDIYVVRTGGNGDTVWTRHYPNSQYDVAWCISPAANNGFIITGYRNYLGSTGTQLYILRIDGAGNVMWEKNYGQSGNDIGYSGTETEDGGFIFCGESNEQGSEYKPLYLVRTNPVGDTLWTRLLGGFPTSSGSCVQLAGDGGFIIAGGTNSTSPDTWYDVYVVKTDAEGTITSVGPETGKTSGMSIFPNPSDGLFHIVADGPVTCAELLDMTGKIVFCQHYSPPLNSGLSIHLPGLVQGFYLIRITTLQNRLSSPLIIR